MASNSLVVEWSSPLDLGIWGVCGWSPTGHMLSLGAYQLSEGRPGLWIYDFGRKQASKVLDGWIAAASWSSDGTKLAFNLGTPYFEIWVADLDSIISATTALGPARNIEGHYQDMVSYYTRRIEADPEDAGNYFLRAQYHEYLHDAKECRADMASYMALNRQSEESAGLQFGTPENLGPVINTPAEEMQPLPSTDGLSFLFKRRNREGYLEYWWTTRKTKDDPWKTAERFTSPRPDTFLAGITTADGLELYSYASGEHGSSDIFMRKREAIDDDWRDPVNLGPVVNSPAVEMSPAISPDGLELYFSDYYTAIRPGGCGEQDLWVTRRVTREDPWSEPVNLGPAVNSAFGDGRPSLSTDGLMLLFDSRRPEGMGIADLYMTRRAATDAPWEEPVNLGPSVNTPAAEYFPHLSADGSILYWDSDRPGGSGHFDIWQVPILIKDHEVLTGLPGQKAKEQTH